MRFGHILGCGWRGPPDPHRKPHDYLAQGWRNPYSDATLGPALDRTAEALGESGCRVTGEQVGDALRKALDWWSESDRGNREPPRPPGGPGLSPRLALVVAILVGVGGYLAGRFLAIG